MKRKREQGRRRWALDGLLSGCGGTNRLRGSMRPAQASCWRYGQTNRVDGRDSLDGYRLIRITRRRGAMIVRRFLWLHWRRCASVPLYVMELGAWSLELRQRYLSSNCSCWRRFSSTVRLSLRLRACCSTKSSVLMTVRQRGVFGRVSICRYLSIVRVCKVPRSM